MLGALGKLIIIDPVGDLGVLAPIGVNGLGRFEDLVQGCVVALGHVMPLPRHICTETAHCALP
jgi:hypothetical protein